MPAISPSSSAASSRVEGLSAISAISDAEGSEQEEDNCGRRRLKTAINSGVASGAVRTTTASVTNRKDRADASLTLQTSAVSQVRSRAVNAPPENEQGLEDLKWNERPELKHPVLITAFKGWNDAGDAASLAAKYLRKRWGLKTFAEIDPERYYDFTVTRPQVSFGDDGQRKLTWPANSFSAARIPGSGIDVILLEGVEPHFRWKRFCGHVAGLAKHFDAFLVVTLGALLADVPHTRPVAIFGTCDDPELAQKMHLRHSNYEGPTGIVGVLGVYGRSVGISSASLWASVPSYTANNPSPKATKALVEEVAKLLGVKIEADDLQKQAEEYERSVDEIVNADEDAKAYVNELEQSYDSPEEVEKGAPERLVAEVEKFLREQPPSQD